MNEIFTALYFIHKVAKKTGNPFAKKLFNRLKNAEGSWDVVDVVNQALVDEVFNNEDVLESMDYTGIERNQDCRFLNLYLKGCRKFPPGDFYGISFGSEQSPKNTLIQGANGGGKSSVFSAMEFLFTGQISTANKYLGLHDVKSPFYWKAIKEYLPNVEGDIDKVQINVTTTSRKHFGYGPSQKLNNEFGSLSLLPFFCSEYDVDNLIEKGLTGYIYEQMGYGLVRDIIVELDKRFSEVASSADESENKKKNEIDVELLELNKEKRVYDSLIGIFTRIVFRLHEEAEKGEDYKSTLREIIAELSKEFINSEDSIELSGGQKLLDDKELEKEKEMLNISEKASFFPYYSTIERKLQSIAGGDPFNSFINQSGVQEELDNFNYARRILKKSVENILIEKRDGNDNEFVLRDYSSCMEKYNEEVAGLEKKLEEKINEEETHKIEHEDFNKYKENKDVYEGFLESLKMGVYNTINSITDIFEDFVKEILDLFLMDDEKFSFSFDKTSGEFQMYIEIHGKKITPREYLNAFRYKLYCMTLKFIIAFAIKKFYDLNFPIVIDDIFYSSDFSHRNKVRDYFRTLFEKHNELFPEENKKLQVIFFSHDEVVIEAAYRGIRDAVSDDVNRLFMYDYQAARDEDVVSISIDDKEAIKYKKLTDSIEI